MIFYVVFVAEQSFGGWWCIFTTAKWRHVAVFWAIPGDNGGVFVQHVEYVRGQIQVNVYPYSAVEWIRRLEDTEQITAIIEYHVDKIEAFYYNLPRFMNCVTVVKAIIGMKSFVLTPNRLAQNLLAKGGHQLWVKL